MAQDGRLTLSILGPNGVPLGGLVDIHLRHQTLSHEVNARDLDSSVTIVIANLHRSPQGLYSLRVTPHGRSPLAQFVTISASGDTLLPLTIGEIVNLDAPLDRNSPQADAFLAGLQGNILKAHARDHAWHLFIDFGNPGDDGREGAREWIGNLLDSAEITSALAQEGQQKTDTFRTLLLTSPGYDFLGKTRPHGGAFREGMPFRASLLNDPPVDQWEDTYRNAAGKIHALMIIASNDEGQLDAAKSKVEADLLAFGGRVLLAERGNQIRNAEGRPIEHFGYADGVSQPQFIFDGGGPDGTRFSQRTPLNRVLEEDPHSNNAYGSFAVYRKLEQNVQSFDDAVRRVAVTLGLDPVLAGAMAIGRFQNGTPLTSNPQPKPGYDPRADEDFDYDEDDGGGRCPFHAHIRKANPRGSLGFFVDLLAREKKRRIARRGITYGARPDLGGAGGAVPSGGVGLIFVCYQNDINDQFEFIQRRWMNGRDFPKPGKSGIDTVVGQVAGAQGPNDFPHWPRRYDAEEDDRQSISFGQHVRLLGGEYFFAPSIEGLRALTA